MRILGLDPGTATTGFGVIEYFNDEYILLDYGCITTPANQPLQLRIKQITQDLGTLLSEWHPKEIAIEELFFSKNVKTAMQVAYARGAMMQRLSSENYEITEYKPQQVKEAVCGYGRAEKIQIQKMVQMILKMDCMPSSDDAADALAIAICHANNLKTKKLFLTA